MAESNILHELERAAQRQLAKHDLALAIERLKAVRIRLEANGMRKHVTALDNLIHDANCLEL